MARLLQRGACLSLILGLGLAFSAALADEQNRNAKSSGQFAGPWNLSVLKQTPPATWGAKTGVVQEVWYEGEPLAGKPTRVFAYVARPESSAQSVPGIVLVHGGGGTAFPEWATLWAKRGYAAIAMDLSGDGPAGRRLADGGPPLGNEATVFHNFTDAEADQMWTYHAVAAVMRGHSLLASCIGVDSNRIGITGISWGGYLTCIVAGIDDRLKVAVPVYGCGYIYENSRSGWLEELAKMSPDSRVRWISLFDPSKYLPGVQCPILFVDGTNDLWYPLDSLQKSYRLVPGQVDLRVEINMPHGHKSGWAPKEIGWFVDSVLTGGDPLPRLGQMTTIDDGQVSAEFAAKQPVVKAQLHYTSNTGPWPSRKWLSKDAKIVGHTVQAELPQERPLVYFLNVTDQRGAMTSTPHATLP
jgi:dienelactone hydrolase